jgi:hypothetical protein
MTVVLCSALACMSAGAGYWFTGRRRRRESNDVLRQVFRRHEYRELDGISTGSPRTNCAGSR